MKHMTSAVVLNWNLQWATPKSKRFQTICQMMAGVAPDVAVLTETCSGEFFDEGHVIASHSDYGYAKAPPERRKVRMWSRSEWTNVDDVGDQKLPGGRFVAGTTQTSSGPLRLIGVCIPWKDAHVRTGRCDRAAWQDHRCFLEVLGEYLNVTTANVPTVLAGDFNQKIPAKGARKDVAAELARVLEGWQVVTSGIVSGGGEQLIDHIAVRPQVEQARVMVLERGTPGGLRLSDHHGVVAFIS